MIILFIQKPMSKKSQNMLQQLINQKKKCYNKAILWSQAIWIFAITSYVY